MPRFYLDFRSPVAYLAMQPTLAMLGRLGARAAWLPYAARWEVLAQPSPEETKGGVHRRVRAQWRRDTHLRYAAVQGVPMRFPDPPCETSCALAGLAYAGPDALDYVQAGFAAFWGDGADLDDLGTVRALLDGAGHDGAGFDPAQWLPKLDEIRAQAVELQVPDAGTLVVDGQVFLGREHLPWAEELLAGGAAT